METVEKAVEVNVPVRTAYNQWTQFEEFPHFMDGVKEVRQTSDTTLHWHAAIGGKDAEWDAQITEQTPDQRIAWSSTSGAHNSGVVTFHRLSDTTTRVTLQMGYEPDSFTEKVGDMLGMVDRRVEGDLKNFKEFVEERGVETGGWRGEVDQTANDRPFS